MARVSRGTDGGEMIESFVFGFIFGVSATLGFGFVYFVAFWMALDGPQETWEKIRSKIFNH